MLLILLQKILGSLDLEERSIKILALMWGGEKINFYNLIIH